HYAKPDHPSRSLLDRYRSINAVAESWFSMLKNEMYHRRSFATRAQARFHVMQYIEVFYNRRRRHSTLGYRTPADVHAEHTRQTAAAA
ncbi:IS3 family transposase, partial [Microbacterium aurantiacum]|uniref:IS3 family transposase n=1 Tax=Microbacterium aurantiacum TaxID=162393 RepID=UPI0031E48F61